MHDFIGVATEPVKKTMKEIERKRIWPKRVGGVEGDIILENLKT